MRLVITLCLCSLIAGTLGMARAEANPSSEKNQPSTATEPGWPGNHQPEADPQPGEPGYLGDGGPVAQPSEGMSDADLRRIDPAGYAQMRAQRDLVERGLLVKARAALKAAGIVPASEGRMDAVQASKAAEVVAAAAVSPYGYLRFTLTPNRTNLWARSGYLGTLYFTYGIYSATTDSYKWYTVSWPARSGDNIPSHQSWVGVGPIPAYTYDLGFMHGAFRGYEADGTASFYPGKWRLDPWTGAPYGRSCLEVHGGSGTHEFAATSGCIRIHPASINSLRSYYTYKMANKYDRNSAHVTVRY